MKAIRGKKGAEMTVGTLVIIVLAIIVLVVLVIGFSTGAGGLWDRIKNFFGGGANIDTIKQGCAMACTTNSQYDYCTQIRDMRAENPDFSVLSLDSKSPDYLKYGIANPDIKSKKVKITCAQIAKNLPSLVFEPCPSISCPAEALLRPPPINSIPRQAA